MKLIEGDLILLAKKGEFDVIVHGCNCFHAMGAGIAKVIAHEFPEAVKADLQTPKGDRAKMGSISTATLERNGNRLTIVNAYTQFDWRGTGRKVDYDAVHSAYHAVAKEFSDKRIGYPLVGAGLAGGEWSEIAPLIDDALGDCDHTLVILPGTKF